MTENMLIHCVVMRGGTSKGVIFRVNDLPPDLELREKIILAIFGSPDPTQIDGLGGSVAVTNKAAIIAPSENENADVDYTFGQVSSREALIDWRGNCGNLSAAVGPFAIDQGLVKAVEPYTTVRIFNTNAKKIIIGKVPVKDGKIITEGDYQIPGVPGSGAKITLEFVDPGGSVTGKILPTGNPRDTIKLDDGREFTVTLVDAGNPAVLMQAKELGLTGTELPDDLAKMKKVTETLETVRSIACQMMGVISDWRMATRLSPAIPKVGCVAEPEDYITSSGRTIKKEEIHILGRLMSMQAPHRFYSVTGGIFTGAAAHLPGTIVYDIVQKNKPADSRAVLIGHPGGVIDVEVRTEKKQGTIIVKGVAIGRTARKIMEGYACVPAEKLKIKLARLDPNTPLPE